MSKSKKTSSKKPNINAFKRLSNKNIESVERETTHIYGNNFRCKTDNIGFSTPMNKGPLDLVLHSSEGFIPLWEKDTILRWRFEENSFSHFADIEVAKIAFRELLGKAILEWGDGVPIKFSERNDSWDFEISVQGVDNCTSDGCIFARAFFPDSGRHELIIFPKMFQASEKEQIETIAHELGHIFGLRHFFAKIREAKWKSEIFENHNPFSIMNYGAESKMTRDDRNDLQKLYRMVWSGDLTHINGTRIKLFRPFHSV